MRAVIDTNILVSGLMQPASPPGVVLQAIAQRSLTPVVCDEVLAEYRAVLPRARLRLPAEGVTTLLHAMERLADWVNVPGYTGEPAVPDAGDWPFIACALAAGCPVITGNLRHFPPTLGVQVLTARSWLDLSSSVG